MEKITMDELLEKFDPDAQNRLRDMVKKEGISHVVLFENNNMWSSRLGERAALAVGPGCEFALEYVQDKYLGDLPGERMYPTALVEVT